MRTIPCHGSPLTPTEVASFRDNGFLVVRGFVDGGMCRELERCIDESLDPPLAPLEFEADVGYPGAPAGKGVRGGFTPRRLLCAYTRHRLFREWSTAPELARVLRELIGSERVALSQNHHNCVMTKYPGFSSLTSWHQDVRYWRFDRPELVSVWLALDDEHSRNGGLSLIPGSHLIDIGRGRLDADLFLRTDIEENREMIDSATNTVLSAGDILLFHCKLFHAAGRNQTDRIKKSPVFTYRALDNEPIPETRSAVYPDIELAR